VPAILHLWGPTGPDDGLDPLGADGSSERLNSATAAWTLGEMVGHDLAERVYGRIDHIIDPCPDPIAPALRGTRLPMRYVPYNGPGAVPLELPGRSGRPRVCVVWGRGGTHNFGQVSNRLPQVVEAATALDAEVLVLAVRADLEACGPLPGTVHPLVEMPLHLVLPDCDAVVHYGGAGVAMTSVAAGIPQLTLSLARNTALFTDRFTDIGCGLTVPSYDAGNSAITGALRRLLGEPSFRTAARELAATAAGMPSPAAVAGSLEEIAAGTAPAEPAAATR
ncbi:nucleotide disphospho-sugar-binding domain-containing protein, partial [Amycolatopsis cihanbeyliensis]